MADEVQGHLLDGVVKENWNKMRDQGCCYAGVYCY